MRLQCSPEALAFVLLLAYTSMYGSEWNFGVQNLSLFTRVYIKTLCQDMFSFEMAIGKALNTAIVCPIFLKNFHRLGIGVGVFVARK